MSKPLMILIAGPYRSGTNDEPDRLAANLASLESVSWPIFRAGHVPMIGEWVALPVMRAGGSTGVGDPISEEVLYPTADRLLHHCDAVLRLPGESKGADQDVADRDRTGAPRLLPARRDPRGGQLSRPERRRGVCQRPEFTRSSSGGCRFFDPHPIRSRQ